MRPAIRKLRAREILDSRGRPTLAVSVELSDSTRAEAMVPSGASTGRHEALELRDGDPARYAGYGVLRAAENVERIIGPALEGCDAGDQTAVDHILVALDGTPDKSRLGANALLGASCAVARAVAVSRGVPLWRVLAGENRPLLPLPMVNILSGGLHAVRNFEFQDFLALPNGFGAYANALEAVVAVHRATRELLDARGYVLTGVADEGGWGPRLESNEKALEILTCAIERAGFRPGDEISIAVDVAATHFYENGSYRIPTEDRVLRGEGMAGLLEDWCRRYPVVSIEDGLAEDDWEHWKLLTSRVGSRVQIVGDDLFTTNPERLARGIREGAANAVLVKMNQIGTLTETLEVCAMARKANYRAVVSARSGETEDSFLADLAVGSGAGQIKIGSITRSERLAKYNRLLEIEAGGGVPYASWLDLARVTP
jgi:enolase